MLRDTTCLTPEQLLQKQEEAITEQAKRDAYFKAQKPPMIGSKPLDSLPSDVLCKIVGEHLPSPDARKFVRTCPSLFFGKLRLEPVLKRLNDEVRQLLVHVMNGNLEAASTMLDHDPTLILEARFIENHQRVTALLLARRMGDIAMCRMLLDRLHAFDTQYHTNHSRLQIEKVAANSQRKAPFDVRNVDRAIDAIAKYQSDVAAEVFRHRNPDQQRTTLSDEMDAYRRSCDEHGEFTAEDLVNVVNALVRNADKFKTYDQFNLFFLQVMGYTERKVPLCLRMALNQGIHGMLQNDNVVDFARATTCVVNNISYSLVNFDPPNSGLGFDFAFNSFGGVPRFDCSRAGGGVQFARAAVGEFCQSTESALVKLMQPKSEPESQPEEVKPALGV